MSVNIVRRVLGAHEVLMLLVAFGMLPVATAAQRPIAKRPPVTVALVDRLPGNPRNQTYDAVIVRRVGQLGRVPSDLILLPRNSANGALLDAAVRTLLTARLRDGQVLHSYHGREATKVTLGVRARAADPDWARSYLPAAQRLVDALVRAPLRVIPDVGVVPAVDFSPPKPRARAAQ